ncbi:MAG: cytidylate kinase-like family protein, partial [Chloroflexi bacterium]|nr:cytidylate kinase-like family protein [Chloroflexota bacterium]
EIGSLVARILNIDYVDRLVLSEASKRIGATVAALAEKEARITPFRQRLGRVLQNALERSAMAGTGGDPFFHSAMDAMILRPYPEAPPEPVTQASDVDERRFVETLAQVIKDLARDGNMVIVGRASNAILKDWPNAVHVGTTASDEFCIKIVARREGFDETKARQFVVEQQKAQVAHYRHHYKVDLADRALYHLIMNTERVDFETAARVVAQAATILTQQA